jgi:hypothetical protein
VVAVLIVHLARCCVGCWLLLCSPSVVRNEKGSVSRWTLRFAYSIPYSAHTEKTCQRTAASPPNDSEIRDTSISKVTESRPNTDERKPLFREGADGFVLFRR